MSGLTAWWPSFTSPKKIMKGSRLQTSQSSTGLFTLMVAHTFGPASGAAGGLSPQRAAPPVVTTRSRTAAAANASDFFMPASKPCHGRLWTDPAPSKSPLTNLVLLQLPPQHDNRFRRHGLVLWQRHVALLLAQLGHALQAGQGLRPVERLGPVVVVVEPGEAGPRVLL